MEALHQRGVQVQSFLSRACFPGYPGAASITGLSARHLDSWLMSPETCREAFVRGAQSADLALVEGRFQPAPGENEPGGRLEPLCQWLDLPRLVVVDVSSLAQCRLPQRVPEVDGVLLDGVAGPEHTARLATEFEAIWGVPVLGALEAMPRLRRQIQSIPKGNRLPREICHALGVGIAKYWKPERLLEIACRRDFPLTGLRSQNVGSRCRKLTVAIAFDEAFNCYFPDTLELLEQQGASVVDFSPLRDENLPPQVDVVYFGCGHPERYASALSENHCMMAALRSHLCAGRRVYAEGGGAAYLCQQMETPEGQRKRMAGILPAIARLAKCPRPAQPIELTVSRSNWLCDKGTRLRGYRNSLWHFEPIGVLGGFVTEPGHENTMAGSFHSVMSLVHLSFAAQPRCIDHFFLPRTALGDPLPWTVTSQGL
jgi:cobyrinic acid a,c-diamide synthase